MKKIIIGIENIDGNHIGNVEFQFYKKYQSIVTSRNSLEDVARYVLEEIQKGIYKTEHEG